MITKIFASRLGNSGASIISQNQFAFVKGRHIQDCIVVALYCFNGLDKRSYGANAAVKLDIRKAFDIIIWRFITEVLDTFGFGDKFKQWIEIIFKSTHLSALINGLLVGFCSFGHGVCQGDPRSPLLICLAEDFFSRYLSLMVEQNLLTPISWNRGEVAPNHLLFCR